MGRRVSGRAPRADTHRIPRSTEIPRKRTRTNFTVRISEGQRPRFNRCHCDSRSKMTQAVQSAPNPSGETRPHSYLTGTSPFLAPYPYQSAGASQMEVKGRYVWLATLSRLESWEMMDDAMSQPALAFFCYATFMPILLTRVPSLPVTHLTRLTVPLGYHLIITRSAFRAHMLFVRKRKASCMLRGRVPGPSS